MPRCGANFEIPGDYASISGLVGLLGASIQFVIFSPKQNLILQ